MGKLMEENRVCNHIVGKTYCPFCVMMDRNLKKY